MSSTTYTVTGMTCSHCVSAVTEEVRKIPGVVDVHVDLASGSVDVSSQSPIDETAVREAVEEAGYELAGS